MTSLSVYRFEPHPILNPIFITESYLTLAENTGYCFSSGHRLHLVFFQVVQ